jgi:hypothetical protein
VVLHKITNSAWSVPKPGVIDVIILIVPTFYDVVCGVLEQQLFVRVRVVVGTFQICEESVVVR